MIKYLFKCPLVSKGASCFSLIAGTPYRKTIREPKAQKTTTWLEMASVNVTKVERTF